jgi:hypothetical protein
MRTSRSSRRAADASEGLRSNVRWAPEMRPSSLGSRAPEDPVSAQPEIHIDDLSQPRLPWRMRLAEVLARPIAEWRIPFETESMLERARKRDGLEDFGDSSFREPLDVLLRSLETEARLTSVGRIVAGELIRALLRNRLRLEALIRRHPEILDEKIEAPIIVVGLPRTGTTHLQMLLSLHPELRSLPLWESLEPVPPANERVREGKEDPRLARCRPLMRQYDIVAPLMRAMHDVAPTLPHEDIQLLAMDFRSLLFEVSYRIPSYVAWYRSRDQTPGYLYLKRVLQALQWLRGPRRWVLKTPQHLEQLVPLFTAFPDARVVQTHRDPVEVTASFCTLISYGMRVTTREIDLLEIGRHWAGRIEEMLSASVRDRERIPAGSILDVRFKDFVGDNLATVERVLAFAGMELVPQARQAMERYNAERPRYVHGRIAYRLEDFGIDAAERRAAFSAYPQLTAT